MLTRSQFSFIAGAGVLFLASEAAAHVSIASGPAFAGRSQEITFGIGHGCEGADTLSIRVEIPSEVLSVRAGASDLGPAKLELDDAGLVVAVTFSKTEDTLSDADTNYYKATLRIGVPNQPFTTLHFPTQQICQTTSGETLEVGWISTEPDAGEGEIGPAPSLTILPRRFAGWNKFTVPEAIEDLSAFFSDALIVWRGDAAYSANPTTTELIADTQGVSELTALETGDEIWVKY